MNPSYEFPYKVDKLQSDLSADVVFQDYMKARISTLQHDDDFKAALHAVLERRHAFYKDTIGITIADDIVNGYKRLSLMIKVILTVILRTLKILLMT